MDNPAEIRKVKCFGVRDEYVRDVGVMKPLNVYEDNVQKTEDRLTVTIFNIVSNKWEIYEMMEQDAICPVCGSYFVVQVIKGTTWFAVCNPACGEYFKAVMAHNKMTPEETMSYFINERLKERRGAA